MILFPPCCHKRWDFIFYGWIKFHCFSYMCAYTFLHTHSWPLNNAGTRGAYHLRVKNWHRAKVGPPHMQNSNFGSKIQLTIEQCGFQFKQIHNGQTYIVLYIYIFVYIHSFVNGHLCCFPMLAIAKIAAMNLEEGMHISFQVSVFIFSG